MVQIAIKVPTIVKVQPLAKRNTATLTTNKIVVCAKSATRAMAGDDVQCVQLFHLCGNDEAFGAAHEMFIKRYVTEKLTGAFENQIDIEIAPRDICDSRNR